MGDRRNNNKFKKTSTTNHFTSFWGPGRNPGKRSGWFLRVISELLWSRFDGFKLLYLFYICFKVAVYFKCFQPLPSRLGQSGGMHAPCGQSLRQGPGRLQQRQTVAGTPHINLALRWARGGDTCSGEQRSKMTNIANHEQIFWHFHSFSGWVASWPIACCPACFLRRLVVDFRKVFR